MLCIKSEIVGPESQEQFAEFFPKISEHLRAHHIIAVCAQEVLLPSVPRESADPHEFSARPRPCVVMGYLAGEAAIDEEVMSDYGRVYELAHQSVSAVDRVISEFGWVARTQVFIGSLLPRIFPVSLRPPVTCDMPYNSHPFNLDDVRAKICGGGHTISADHNIDKCPAVGCGRALRWL